ncbi:MAG: hypothetical protein MI757_20840, partial [Pirellulales bacterium]|nr:hypothetical protein [Pirellulales bacterium]
MTAWRGNTTVRWGTLLLVLIAGAVLTVVRAGAAISPVSMAIRSVCELFAFGYFSYLLCRRANTLQEARSSAAIAVLVAGLYPFVAEFLLRRFAGGSEPPELSMSTSLQLMAVVLAVFSQLPMMASAAVLLTSFLLLFLAAMNSSLVTIVLTCVYGLAVLWWLMGA